MDPHNIHRVRTPFSKLTDQVENGEEVLIAQNGHAAARMVAEKKPMRQPGRLKGKIRIKKGFDDPLPAGVRSAFSGELD